jgi:hypothetical protein
MFNTRNKSGISAFFTTAKRALSFQQKRAFIHEIPFSFFKWGTLARKKGTFFTFKKVWWGHMPPLPLLFPLPLVFTLQYRSQFVDEPLLDCYTRVRVNYVDFGNSAIEGFIDTIKKALN